MTNHREEAERAFEKWWNKKLGNHSDYGSEGIDFVWQQEAYQAAWTEQQRRIDELEAKLKEIRSNAD